MIQLHNDIVIVITIMFASITDTIAIFSVTDGGIINVINNL